MNLLTRKTDSGVIGYFIALFVIVLIVGGIACYVIVKASKIPPRNFDDWDDDDKTNTVFDITTDVSTLESYGYSPTNTTIYTNSGGSWAGWKITVIRSTNLIDWEDLYELDPDSVDTWKEIQDSNPPMPCAFYRLRYDTNAP